MADLFTPKCTPSETISIIAAAPPNTAVYHALTGGWNTTDHILATMSEQQAGLVRLPHRHSRPGVDPEELRQRPPTRLDDRNNSSIALDVLPLTELMKRLGG